MAILGRFFSAAGALLDLLIRIVYLPIQIISFLFTILPLIFVIALSLALAGGSYFLVAKNGDVFIESVDQAWRCSVTPFYSKNVEPIFNAIHRFYNPVICWWDGFILWPQIIGRNVVFPVILDCGLLDVMVNMGTYFEVVFEDWLLGHVASGDFFSQPLDYTRICNAWQTFWASWQSLLCCGCFDLCAPLTRLPVIPMMFTSSQLSDDEWWCFIDNSTNGILIIFQEFLRIVALVLFGHTGSKRPQLRPAFDLLCDATRCFFRSWENALQLTWDTFVPYDFVWRDFLCVFEKITCTLMLTMNLVIDIVFATDLVLEHFRNVDSAFWKTTIKRQFTEIVNLWATVSRFDPITETLPSGTMEILHYQLTPYDQATPEGLPNPLFGKQGQLVTDCACVFAERLLCDPTNVGITCAERYNNTLLENVDVCCFTTNMARAMAETATALFEVTLHVSSTDDFVVFIDRQPFSTFVKTAIIETFNCLFDVFRAIEIYGGCIDNALSEAVLFVGCMAELLFRVAVALVTLPYFETELPMLENFLTRPGDEALNMALEFLDRVGDIANPQGLINCMCFLLNSGFSVPPAGCSMATEPCSPTGFIDPTLPVTRRTVNRGGTHDYHRKYGLQPILMYSQPSGAVFADGIKEVSKAIPGMESTLNRMHGRLSTMPPTNLTVGCDTCFNLCCLPSKVVTLTTHGTAFVFRAFNAAFQTRFGAGSGYWDGSDCTMIPGQGGALTGVCLATDSSTFVSNLLAPLTCICNFIQLVIPPMEGIDPCCLFTLIGDLIGCAIQIVINVANSIASDPEYRYIRDETMLQSDFDVIADISIAAVDCACDAIRTIFNFIQDVTPLTLSKNFDPCCIPQKIFEAVVDAARLLFRLIVSLSTLEEEETSRCFLYIRDTVPNSGRANCAVGVAQLPIVMRFNDILDKLFAPPASDSFGQCVQLSGHDQKVEGIATCYCTLIQSTLSIIFRPESDLAASCPLNLCCIVYRTTTILDEFLRFSFQLIVSLWQNWTKEIINDGLSEADIPAGFVDFFFCDEYIPGGSVIPGNDVQSMLYNITNPLTNPTFQVSDPLLRCGRFEPVLTAFKLAVDECFCSSDPDPSNNPAIGDVVDNFLEWFFYFIRQSNPDIFGVLFKWPRCICEGGRNGRGIVRPLSNVLVVATRQIVTLFRNLPNPSYWRPAGGSFTSDNFASTLTNNLEDVEQSWIARFLGPFADSLCEFVTNSACFLAFILGDTCELPRYNFVASAIRYLLEGIIKALIIIEAFVRLFLQEMPGVCVGNQEVVQGESGEGLADDGSGASDSCAPPNAVGAIFGLQFDMTEKLTSIVVASTQFVVDALLGISIFSCTRICPVRTGGFVFDPDYNATFGDPYAGLTDKACSCYNDSPYKVGVEYATTLEACRAALDLPSAATNFTVCPGGAPSCSYNDACRNPPGTQFIQNPIPPIRGAGTTIFTCAASLSADGSNTVNYGIGDENKEGAFDRWVYITVDQTLTITQPTGCLFAEAQTEYGEFEDPALGGFNAGMIDTEEEFKGLVRSDTPNPTGSVGSWGTNPSTAGTTWEVVTSGGMCGLRFPAGATMAQQDFWTYEAELRFGPGLTKPLCEREYCVANGFCKNDQMVPCSRAALNAIPLDGIVVSLLKYLSCLVKVLKSRSGDSVIYDVLDIILNLVLQIISIVWQLSAGIIKLVVSGTILTLKFMLDFNPITRLLTGFFIVIDFFENFFAIFSQPIVTSAGGNVPARSAPHKFKRETQEQIYYETALQRTMGVNVDGCIENPVECMCTADLRQSCDVNATTIEQVMTYMADVFTGAGECDSLIQTCAGMAPTTWTDVPYSERFIYIDCIGKRIQGERFSVYSDGVWPKDFFYSPDGWYKLLTNAKAGIEQNARRKDRQRRQRETGTARKHRRNRKVTKTMSQYYRGLASRAVIAKHVIRDRVGISQDSLAFEFTVEMDRVWFKYRTGYYHYLGDLAMRRIRRDGVSVILGSYEDVMHEVLSSVREIGGTTRIVYAHGKEALHEAGKGVADVYSSIHRWVVDSNRNSNGRSQPRPATKIEEPRRLLNLHWYGSNTTTDSTNEGTMTAVAATVWSHIYDHVGSPWSLLRVDPAIKQALAVGEPQWTPQKVYNVESLQRMFYRAAHTLVPHMISRESHQRFILNGNCRLVNDAVEETAIIIDFCLNNYAYNLPNGTFNGTFARSRLQQYLDDTSPLRKGSIRHKYGDRVRVEEFAGRKRLRLVIPEQQPAIRHDRRVYRRAMSSSSFIGGFNLFEWFICAIEDLFNISLLQSSSDLVADIKAWFLNPNTDPALYPDVGGVYWLKFFLVCEFPENVSCMIGIGLEEALKRVTVVYAIVMLILLALGLLSVVTLLLSPIVYWVIVMAVAYHWSPMCLNVFPSFTLGAGISIPFLPVPIGPWALPMCLWDDIMTLLSKIFSGCLDWLIPAALVNGAVCPVCPAPIDVVNCLDIGMGDGLSNILYLLYKWLGPTFCDVIIGISSTVLGGIIPGAQDYLMTVLNTFKTASPEQLERLDICSVATAGSIAFVLVGLLLLGGILLYVIPALYAILLSALGLLSISNVYESLLGQGEPTEYDIIPGDEDTLDDNEDNDEDYDEDDGEDDANTLGSDVAGKIASFMRRNVIHKHKYD